jgi:cytochrome d ubiquinol oxidase subunit I
MFMPGLLMIATALGAVFLAFTKRLEPGRSGRFWRWFLLLLPLATILPYLANTGGWLLTELGRQPWIVYGLLRTADGVSPTLTPGMVWFSLLAFALVYAALLVADVYLLTKYSRSTGATEPSGY